MRLLFWIVLVAVESDFILAAHRAKRLIAFRTGSTFFYRLNWKITTIPGSPIFAQASGFKVTWPLPDDTRNRRSIEDLHETVQDMYDSHGLNGRSCLIQNICEALAYAEQTGGVIGKILKLLSRIVLLLMLLTYPALVPGTVSANSGETRILSRQRRHLIFPEGSNVQLVYCLTIGALPRPQNLVVGLTAALAWELPNKVEPKIAKVLHRQSRSVIFPKIEAFLQSTGLDGRSCVLKALCEAGQRHKSHIGKGTFVEEVLDAIFRLRNDGSQFEKFQHRVYDSAYESTGDCAKEYPTCKHSIYELHF